MPAARPRRALVERERRGEVDDVERAARQIGEVDRARDVFGLEFGRTRVFEEIGAVQAFAQGLVLEIIDDHAVLRVHEHLAAVPPDDVERCEEIVVWNAAAPAPLPVAHHDLEARDAAVDGLGDIGEVVEILEYPGVQREVDHARRLALLADALKRGEHGFVLLARGEGDHGGDAPVGCAARNVFQGIDVVRKRPEVDVGVDDARQRTSLPDASSASAASGMLSGRAHAGDPPVADPDGGLLPAVAGYDSAARNDQVERFLVGSIRHENSPCKRPPRHGQTLVSRRLFKRKTTRR